MSVIKIIKNNKLKIPIGTILHYYSFYDRIKPDNPKMWDSVCCYVWKESSGALNIINQDLIYPDLDGSYVNCIAINNRLEFLYEGDEYWKVFHSEQHAKWHKLEFDGIEHTSAIPLKPYRDTVYWSTGFIKEGCSRFKTLEEAESFCNTVKEYNLLKK